MSEYADRLTAGEEPTKAPELMPEASEARVTIITGKAVHEIDGVPSTAAEKRFHEQATAAIEREFAEAKREGQEAWPVRMERAIAARQEMLHGAFCQMSYLRNALEALHHADLSQREQLEIERIFAVTTQIAARIATLSGRDFPPRTRLLELLPYLEPLSIRDQRQAELDRARLSD